MIVNVRVKTGQRHFRIVKGQEWVISVQSRPERGLANREIINELSKEYGSVRIIKGNRSNKKVLALG